MSPRLAVLLSATLLATGCQVATDLGNPCILKKKQAKKDAQGNTIGFEVVDIRERELTPGQDYISFGATDCEDLICVRDVSSPPNPEYKTVDDPKTEKDETLAEALGYCSRPCIQGSGASACEVTNSDVSETLRSRMDCRSLLLDQESLDKLRAEDPDAYRATFGDTNSPYFCAGTPIQTEG